MKVVNVFYFYNKQVSSEEALIRFYYTTTGWGEALQQEGVDTIIMTRFHKDSYYVQNNIQHYFVKDALGPHIRAWHLPWRFLRQVKALEADVVHVHSLTLSLQTFLLRWVLHKKTAIVIQHHGGKAPSLWRRKVHNWLNRVADAFFFTTTAQGGDWWGQKEAPPKVLPVMEGATYFDYDNRDAAWPSGYADRAMARTKTGMQGAPVFLWVGRLDDNKDPLTVLNGFKIFLAKYPRARLYMIYSDDQLLPQVIQLIASSGVLQNQVVLLGRVPHEAIASYYNSADYFVLGSHYEGAGYALSEALRCGCIPIVTHIPSFRRMTHEGQLGALWTPGDRVSLIKAVEIATSKPLEAEAQACIDFYQQQLSFQAIARVAAQHYRQIVERRLQRVNQSWKLQPRN